MKTYFLGIDPAGERAEKEAVVVMPQKALTDIQNLLKEKNITLAQFIEAGRQQLQSDNHSKAPTLPKSIALDLLVQGSGKIPFVKTHLSILGMTGFVQKQVAGASVTINSYTGDNPDPAAKFHGKVYAVDVDDVLQVEPSAGCMLNQGYSKVAKDIQQSEFAFIAVTGCDKWSGKKNALNEYLSSLRYIFKELLYINLPILDDPFQIEKELNALILKIVTSQLKQTASESTSNKNSLTTFSYLPVATAAKTVKPDVTLNTTSSYNKPAWR